MLLSGTVVGVIGFSMPQNAFGAVSIVTSADSHGVKFYGPSFLHVLITDTSLAGAPSNITAIVSVNKALGGGAFAQTITVGSIGTSGQFELFITTSNSPAEPQNPMYTDTSACGTSTTASFVVRMNNGPASGDGCHDTPITASLGNGDSISISYGGSTSTVTFAPSVASIMLDRATAGDGNTIYVSMTDQDGNFDPTAPDILDAKPSGITLIDATGATLSFALVSNFTETGANTATFEFPVIVNGALLLSGGGSLTNFTFPQSVTFTFHDKDVYHNGAAGSTPPYNAISPLVSNSTSNASVNLQNADGSLSVPATPTPQNNLHIQVADPDRNIDTGVADTLAAGKVVASVMGISSNTYEITGASVTSTVGSTGNVTMSQTLAFSADPGLVEVTLGTITGTGVTIDSTLAWSVGSGTNRTVYVAAWFTTTGAVTDAPLGVIPVAISTFNPSTFSVTPDGAPLVIAITGDATAGASNTQSIAQGTGGIVNGVAFEETGDNTAIFLPDLANNEIPITIGASDTIASTSITLTQATASDGPEIVIAYLDDAGSPSGPKIITLLKKIHAPTISFDQLTYDASEFPFITVFDVSADTASDVFDVIEVRVFSDSDAVGIDAFLSETGQATAVFTGNITLTTGFSAGALSVASGDTITAEYDPTGEDQVTVTAIIAGSPSDTTPPTLSSISDSPDPFSPNGDGINDTVAISFTSDEPGTYNVIINGTDGYNVATLSGAMAAGVNTVVWNGTFSGSPLPDRDYIYFILAEDASGNPRPILGPDGTITIDKIFPAAPLITSPGNSTTSADNTPTIDGLLPATFVSKFGNLGSSLGQFNRTFGVAFGPDGTLYAADANNNRINLWSGLDLPATGIGSFGSFGSGDGQFVAPSDVAVDSDGFVYVADNSNNRIQKFDSTGNFVAKWGTGINPIGVAVGPADGNIYVAGVTKVQKYTPNGTLITEWGSSGSGDGQFNFAAGISVDPSGFVYVADTNNHRVQKFNSNGTFVAAFGGLGSGEGQFSGPKGIEVTADGKMYVTDTGSFKVHKFFTNGTFITRWGSEGSADGEFAGGPWGITVGPDRLVYVGDTENHRIQRFDPPLAGAVVQLSFAPTMGPAFTTSVLSDPSGSGAWSSTVGPLPDDTYFISVRSIDEAGNTSPLSGTLVLTIDAPSGGGVAPTLDDTMIAFATNRDGNSEIYVMNADGTNQTRLTNNTAIEEVPRWSPDGTKIAFESNRDGNREIYVMNANGSAQTNITNNPATDSVPSWSPDGTKIAFTSIRDGNDEIYVMNANGSGVTRLTNNSAFDGHANWSPDGTKIAFVTTRDGSTDVYVMNADGSGQTNISNNTASDSLPSWSPDGTKIAFMSDRDGNPEIYVMNADGSGVTRLTNNSAFETFPSWSPDGTKIAFMSNRDGNFEIYVMNADGSGQTNITNNPATDLHPNWSPHLTASLLIDVSDTNPPWGVDVFANVTVTGAHIGDYVVVSQGNGATFTYPAFTASFDGELELTVFAYNTTEIGGTFDVSATLYDSSDSPVATSNIVPVTVEKRPATLTLRLPSSVVNGTIFTASGDLADGITGFGLSGRTITFTTLPGISLGATTTQGIDVVDPSGIEIVSCPVPQCTHDNPNASTVNLFKLHPASGATFYLPPGVTAMALTLQDMSGTVTVKVVRSDSSSYVATSDPAGTGLATFVLSARDRDHQTQFLESVEILSTSVPGELFATSKIELFDADADPTTLVSAMFDLLPQQSYGTNSTIAPGAYYASATAPTLVLPSIPVSAHFAGDLLYSPADDGNDPDLTFATEQGFPLESAGIGGSLAVYANANPSFTVLSCSAADPDDDGDGLCNSWEDPAGGIPYACGDATCLYVLPTTTVPGTNTVQTTSKDHKDIFVEIDAMDGQAPLDAALRRVIDAFARAPVQNIDRFPGITLHVIKDQMNLPFVGKVAGTTFNAWVDPVVGGDDLDKTNDYFGIKSMNYGTNDEERTNTALKNARANAIRYSLWVSSIGDSTTSGLAEDLGNDMIVSLGNFGGDGQGTETEQASAFMHELGHMLNLKHGGPGEIITEIEGTQTNAATVSLGGLRLFPRETTLEGYTLTTMGPGSGTIELQQVVDFGGDVSGISSLTVSEDSLADSKLGTPTISIDGSSTSTKKIFNIHYPFDNPYVSPLDSADHAIDFGSSNAGNYLTAADNTVYNVTTEDFWMAGMFKRTGDSGVVETIVRKKATFAGADAGYHVDISSSDQLQAAISDGTASAIFVTVTSTTISTNVWYAWAYYADRDGNQTLYLYNLSTGTLSTASTSITAQQATMTTTQTFNVARSSGGGSFFPGVMDMLIPPQIGQTLTQAQFLEYATTGRIAGVTPTNLYNFNGQNANDAIGGNHLTLNGSPTFSTNVPNINLAIDFGSPNISKYLRAATSSVYDVTTEDFWMAGMFKRTSDSGAVEHILRKKSTFVSATPGYHVTVTANDQLQVIFGDGSASSISVAILNPTITTNVWYAWGASFDRDGNLIIWLYNMNTGALNTASTSIAAQQGSATTTQTFTVARNSGGSDSFFPGVMDMLIPPQIGQTLTEAQFLEFATTGRIAGVTQTNLYNFNGQNANDAIGGNHLTLNGSPTFSTNNANTINTINEMSLGKLKINFNVSPNVNIIGFGTPAYPSVTEIIPEDNSMNCKPNYQSILSYSRQMDNYLNGAGEHVLDYSRGNYAPLLETNLNEDLGLFSGVVLSDPNVIIYGSTTGLSDQDKVQKATTYGPGESVIGIDWDMLGGAGGAGRLANINNLSITGCNTGGAADYDTVTFYDYNDWNNIKLNWKENALGTFDGITRAANKAAIEMTEEIDQEIKNQVTTIQVDTLTEDKINYGESIGVSGSTSNAPENAKLSIDWGDGTIEVFEGVVDPLTGDWSLSGLLSHTYESSATGERRIVVSLMDAAGFVEASSSGTTVLVLKDRTAISLDLTPSIVSETQQFTLTGTLSNLDHPGQGVAGRTITFTSSDPGMVIGPAITDALGNFMQTATAGSIGSFEIIAHFEIPTDTDEDVVVLPSQSPPRTLVVGEISFSGVLSPIKADGSSVFKQKSTVPIKFQLTDSAGNFITDAVATLRVVKISGAVTGTEEAGFFAGTASSDSLFRYDAESNQYYYNLGTKNMDAGTWGIKIYLNYGTPTQMLLDNDGDGYSVRISLRA